MSCRVMRHLSVLRAESKMSKAVTTVVSPGPWCKNPGPRTSPDLSSWTPLLRPCAPSRSPDLEAPFCAVRLGNSMDFKWASPKLSGQPLLVTSPAAPLSTFTAGWLILWQAEKLETAVLHLARTRQAYWLFKIIEACYVKYLYSNWIGAEFLLKKSTWTFQLRRVSDISVILFQLPCCPWPWKPFKWFLPQSIARPYVANRNWTRATKRDWLQYLQWSLCNQTAGQWSFPEQSLQSHPAISVKRVLRSSHGRCILHVHAEAWKGLDYIVMSQCSTVRHSCSISVLNILKTKKKFGFALLWVVMPNNYPTVCSLNWKHLETHSSSEVPAWPTPVYMATVWIWDAILAPPRSFQLKKVQRFLLIEGQDQDQRWATAFQIFDPKRERNLLWKSEIDWLVRNAS